MKENNEKSNWTFAISSDVNENQRFRFLSFVSTASQVPRHFFSLSTKDPLLLHNRG